jgi:hypothetical protein
LPCASGARPRRRTQPAIDLAVLRLRVDGAEAHAAGAARSAGRYFMAAPALARQNVPGVFRDSPRPFRDFAGDLFPFRARLKPSRSSASFDFQG